ncbi:MAG: ATP-binding protein, partial [Rikenellaceae bacterium]
MRILTNIIFSLCLCVAVIYSTTAATFSKDKELKLINGMPDNGVTSLLQDSRGYIWIGTYGGLARYNGHSLTTFNNTIKKRLFRSNRIRSLFEDSLGAIWIGTDIGVMVYDYETSRFSHLEYLNVKDHNRECIVRKILSSEDNRHILCLTERDGVLIYNDNYELLKHFALNNSEVYNDALHLDGNIYLLTSNQGVSLYNFESGELTPASINASNGENYLTCAIRFDANKILCGAQDGIRIITYNIVDGEVKIDVPKDSYYSNRIIKTLSLDEDGGLWIGGQRDGVFYLSNAKERMGRQLTSLSEGFRVSTILDSKSGVKWVGAFDEGLYSYKRDNTTFKNLDTSSIKSEGLWSINVVPFDDNHIIYQHKYNSISLFDLRDGKEKPLPFEFQPLSDDESLYLLRRSNGDFYFFVQNDGDIVRRMVVKSGSDRAVCIDEPVGKGLKLSSPYSITEDSWGDIWVGTQSTLTRLQMSGDNIEKAESIKLNPKYKEQGITKIRSIYNDPYSKSVWIASEANGLFRINIERRSSIEDLEIDNFLSTEELGAISSNFVTSIVRTHANSLFVGTEQGGLCRVDESSDTLKFTSYGSEDGLASNNIKRITCNKSGNLWIATNFGVSQFNPEIDTFITYRKEHGLMNDEFLYTGATAGDNIVFTNKKDLCYFNPEELSGESQTPNIEFSYLKIFDEIVAPLDEYNGRTILDRALLDGDVIDLKHNENMFSVGIDVLYNDIAHGNEVRYRLLPLFENWVLQPYDTQEISFRGLKYGDYTLEITASNQFGEFAPSHKLSINIAPPFWLSWWAFAIYMTIIAVAIYLISHFLRLRHRLHIETINKENLERSNADKLRYFSNISHELKTPLTLIMAPIAMLKDRFSLDYDILSKLNIVDRQSDRMLRLIELANNIELNDLKLLSRNNSSFSFAEFICNISPDFEFKANFDSKVLSIEPDERDIVIEADMTLLEKLLYNLLSNAFKHTRNGDRITLKYWAEGGDLFVSVEDSGYGIAEEDVDHIFERFYRAKDQAKRNIGGTGIGLFFSKSIVELHGGEISVKSRLNEGTKFTVKLPIVIEIREQELTQIATKSDAIEPLTMGELSVDRKREESEFSNSMVFIVEDNPEMRQLIISITSRFYCVKSFANGAECCEALNGEWPDLIISDIMMPEMDGYELCQAVKGDIKTSHIPIILLTACTTIDDKIQGLEYGADSYIPK